MSVKLSYLKNNNIDLGKKSVETKGHEDENAGIIVIKQ